MAPRWFGTGCMFTFPASAFDITTREIQAATKSRGSYNGRAQIVANLQTMPTTPTQRADLPDLAFHAGNRRATSADFPPVTARAAGTDRR
jgi:hypothetical protein